MLRVNERIIWGILRCVRCVDQVWRVRTANLRGRGPWVLYHRPNPPLSRLHIHLIHSQLHQSHTKFQILSITRLNTSGSPTWMNKSPRLVALSPSRVSAIEIHSLMPGMELWGTPSLFQVILTKGEISRSVVLWVERVNWKDDGRMKAWECYDETFGSIWQNDRLEIGINRWEID